MQPQRRADSPVLRTMLPSTGLSARRRTSIIFYDTGKELEKLAIARYDVGNLLKGVRDIDVRPKQGEALAKISILSRRLEYVK